MIYNVRVSLEYEIEDLEADSELEAAEIAKDLAVAAGGWECTVRPKAAAAKKRKEFFPC